MVVTKEWLVENDNKYNNLIFNGGLPTLQRGKDQWVNFDLKVNNYRVYLGLFCQRKKALFGDMNYTIKISRYYDRDEKDLINTLVHEMIHCYIAYNHIRDTSPHGVEFIRIMRKLNRQYGLNMRVRSIINGKPSAPKNEEYYTNDTILHGSARSAQGVNLVPLMEQLKAEGLIIEFGGHSEAIGIKFYHRDMDKVQARLDELVQFVDKDVEAIFEEEEQTILIDEILTLENLNVVILALSNILPTDGRQLREATFAITNCEVKSFKTYPSGYMEVTLKQGNKVLDMSAMGYAEKFSTEILPELDGKDKPLVHIAGSITKHFKSKKYVLNIVDIVVA